MALPSGAGPRTEQRAPTLEPSNKERAPTQEPALSKRNVFRPWCPVFALAWLAAPVLFWVLFSQARFRLVPVCLCSFSCFFPLAAGVTFQLPEGGTSGQTQGHPPKNWYWAPTQGPGLQVRLWTFDVLGLWFPASEATSRRDTWSCAS